MSCPPSPGLAPWAHLICSSSALTRYSVLTPNLPEATCLTAERMFLPPTGTLRDGSSPPSPQLLFAPRRFAASVMVSWASLLMAPNDMASMTNLFTISDSGSTSSKGTGLPFFASMRSRMKNRPSPRSAFSANALYSEGSAAAACRSLTVSGDHVCLSPPARYV